MIVKYGGQDSLGKPSAGESPTSEEQASGLRTTCEAVPDDARTAAERPETSKTDSAHADYDLPQPKETT